MTCPVHAATTERQARLCAECEYEREQTERKQRRAEQDRAQLRVRMALQFALLIAQRYDADHWDQVAREACAAADAMLFELGGAR